MLEEDCVGGGLCWSRIVLEGYCKCPIMCKIINYFFPLKLYAKKRKSGGNGECKQLN